MTASCRLSAKLNEYKEFGGEEAIRNSEFLLTQKAIVTNQKNRRFMLCFGLKIRAEYFIPTNLKAAKAPYIYQTTPTIES